MLGSEALREGGNVLTNAARLSGFPGDTQALLAPETVRLPARVQAVYVQNAGKVLAVMCQVCKDDGELGRVLDMLPDRLRAVMRSPHVEVRPPGARRCS